MWENFFTVLLLLDEKANLYRFQKTQSGEHFPKRDQIYSHDALYFPQKSGVKFGETR